MRTVHRRRAGRRGAVLTHVPHTDHRYAGLRILRSVLMVALAPGCLRRHMILPTLYDGRLPAALSARWGTHARMREAAVTTGSV